MNMPTASDNLYFMRSIMKFRVNSSCNYVISANTTDLSQLRPLQLYLHWGRRNSLEPRTSNAKREHACHRIRFRISTMDLISGEGKLG